MALTAMGIFFSFRESSRGPRKQEPEDGERERERDSSSRKGRMQSVVETISVLHSTAQHSTAQLSTNEKK